MEVSHDLERKGLLLVLSGPSGVGKNTVLNSLLTVRTDVRYSISVTTRTPRVGEKDGVNYFFVDRAEFRRMVEEDELLEWAEVYGNFYGTPRKLIEQSLKQGISVVLDIDPQGARQVRQKMPQGVFAFLMPPSWEILRNRIYARGTDGEEQIRERLNAARTEMMSVENYDYIIMNDDLNAAVNDLSAILTAERCRVGRTHYHEFLEKFFGGRG